MTEEIEFFIFIRNYFINLDFDSFWTSNAKVYLNTMFVCKKVIPLRYSKGLLVEASGKRDKEKMHKLV